MYRGGNYGDRDGQLTAYIQANFPNALTPTFNEYDIDFRPTRRTQRNADRIVRDSTNGFIFFTDDHYANFHLYAYQNLPDVDDAQPSMPDNTFTVDNSLTPVAEETAGDPPAGGDRGGTPDPLDVAPSRTRTASGSTCCCTTPPTSSVSSPSASRPRACVSRTPWTRPPELELGRRTRVPGSPATPAGTAG
ncbi:ribonuclease domain-containing protein [Streptomyces phaeochromogenes]|uniref:ribonuclease domain-containing protein n=1 Tax=Streptomyces phaeochromogenes TaxID=1923 RepID=UPI0036924EEE